MRKDLHKVITERERTGGHDVPSSKDYIKGYIGRDWEDEEDRLDQLPRTESMRERLEGNGKSFTDVLGPLKGVLRKACGRKWDDVWAEFHKIFPPVNVQYQHIYEHIKGYVCTDTYLVNNKVCYRQQLSSYRYHSTQEEFVPLDSQEYGFDFYKHPISGILKEVKRKGGKRERRKRYLQEEQRQKDSIYRYFKKEHYMKISGQWYKVELIDAEDVTAAKLSLSLLKFAQHDQDFHNLMDRSFHGKKLKSYKAISRKEKKLIGLVE